MSCTGPGDTAEPDTLSNESAVIATNKLTANRLSPNGINLNGINLNGINLNGINLNGINLNGINLNGIGLNGINLNGINLNGINLNGINLNGLYLNGINLNGINLNGINLNGINLNGINLNGINLNGLRLNGINLNGINLNGINLNGINLNGIRLNGINLNGINLNGINLNGAPLTTAQLGNFKLALSYVAKCSLEPGQCVTVTDVDGVSTYSMCGEDGLDPVWNTDLAASVTHEHAVTQCVIDTASSDSANPGNTISHTNQERQIVKDFFAHAVSCALPAGTCVTSTDVDGVSTYTSCGSQGLDPAWQAGPATGGAVAAQVASCVTSQASAHGDAWLDYRTQLTTVLRYATECALRNDQSISVTDWNGAPLTWQGSLGLADWWTTAPLSPAPSPKPAAAGEELVSACLMARSNAAGHSVSISLRARPEAAATPEEAAAYGRHEGAFMGNLFSATAVARSCSGPGGGGWIWDPSTNAPLTAGRQCADGTSCGFEYLGACSTVCNVKPGVGGETLFDECAGNSNVVNTFLFSVVGFDVDDTAKSYYAVTQSPLDAPMTAAGDFNRDGFTDLAVETNGPSLLVRLGKSDGGFAPDVVYNLGATTVTKAVIAKDINGDGNLDLVTANQDSLSVLIGNGKGGFAAPTRLVVSGAAGLLASVAAGDFNGDGKLDLATTLTSGVGVFLGNGNGTFGSQSTGSGGNLAHSLVAGDFNGDGKIDLAAAASDAPSVYVSWGSGNGSFGPVSTLSVGSTTARPVSLTAGDYNSDSRTDLAAAVSVDNAVKVLFGQSNKSFTTQSYAIAGTGNMTFVKGAYLDGDAARDLLVGRGSSIVLLAGSSGGTFTTAGTFDAGESTRSVVAGYFDRDATWRLDLIASSDVGRLVQLPGM